MAFLITELMASAEPETNIKKSERIKLRDIPKRIMERPYITTEIKRILP